MNIAHSVPATQEIIPSSRKERRQLKNTLEKKKRALERKLRRINPDVIFDNTFTTTFGSYFTLATFKEAIGFKQILNAHISPLKHWNSIYSTTNLFDYLTDACLLGQTRFDHTVALRHDPGYLTIKDLKQFPSERRFRDLMSRCTDKTLEELRSVNNLLIHLRARHEGPRHVWLDFDDSVITLFGEQECAEIGYNPRYHGRPSLKAKLCFVAEISDLLHLRLYGGRSHLLTDF